MSKQSNVILAAAVLLVCGLGTLTAFRPGIFLETDHNLLLSTDERRSQELDRQREEGLQRINARGQIVTEVIEGRLSLLEAAVRFRDLNETSPYIMSTLRDSYPECSDDERHCWHVLVHVEGQLIAEPDKAGVAARLREELAAHREQGTLRLPSPMPR